VQESVILTLLPLAAMCGTSILELLALSSGLSGNLKQSQASLCLTIIFTIYFWAQKKNPPAEVEI